MGFTADSSVKRPRNKCALASVRVSDGSTPRFLQGPFEFEGNGLDKPSLIDESLRYVVPAGAVTQPVYFRGAGRRRQRHGRRPLRRGDPRARRRRAVRITVFGDEPHGNYNRIMLSRCWPARTTRTTSPQQPRLVRRQRRRAARRRPGRPDRPAPKLVHADDGTVTPTTTWSSPPAATVVHPADDRVVHGRRRRCCPASSASAPSTTPGRCSTPPAHRTGGGHRRRPARAGGRPRRCRTTGCTSTLVHAGPHLMNAQLDAEAGAILRSSVESLGIAVHLDVRATEVRPGPGSRGVVLADGRRLDCDLLVVAAGIRPNRRRRPVGAEVERAIVVDDQLRTDDPDIYASASAPSTAARSTAWSPRCGSRPRCSPTSLTGTDPTPSTTAPDGDEAQGRRRRRRRDGRQHPRAGRRRVPRHLRAGAGCTSRWSSATTSWSAPPCSATPARSRS
jgi:hypothetical protein